MLGSVMSDVSWQVRLKDCSKLYPYPSSPTFGGTYGAAYFGALAAALLKLSERTNESPMSASFEANLITRRNDV
jgi:hypothetical protein